MYLKHVAHSTLHRQAHASLIRDHVQHTQATPVIRFGYCHSEASASQLPAPALAAAIPKHPRLSRPRSAGLSARRRRSVSAPTARLVPGCAGRSRPPPRLALSIPPGASCLKSRLVPILGWAAAGAASTGCWQLQLPAATCRAVIAAAKRQADAAVRVSAAYPFPGV